MAIAYRDITFADHGDGGVISRPAATQVDDVLIVFIIIQNGGTVTAPSGWTLIEDTIGAGASAATHHSFWRIAAAGDPSSWTFSQTGGNWALCMVAYSGCDTASPIGPKGEATTLTAPSVTSLVDNCMLVTFHGSGGTSATLGSNATWTAPSGMSNRSGENFADVVQWFAKGLICDLAIASAGATGTKAATLNESNRPASQSILLIPSDAEPPPEQDKTIAERFYLGTVADDQTFTSEAQIRKAQETAPGSNVTTTITWTSTTAAVKTVRPLTANSTTADTTSNDGWAINNAGTDGMNSTADVKRRLLAGVWDFSADLAVNAPPTLGSRPASNITAKVYRVATGGGTRTLLFSATPGATFNTTGIRTWSSSSQPAYTLEAGEVIMVGYTMTSAAATNTVGGVNNTIWTLELAGDTWFEVPTPGVRSLVILSARSGTVTPGVGNNLKKIIRTFESGVASSSGLLRKTMLNFTSGVTSLVGAVFKRPTRRYTGTQTPGPGIITRRIGRVFPSTITPGPSADVFLVKRILTSTVTSSSLLGRGLYRFYVGTITSTGQPFKQATRRYASTATSSGVSLKRPTRILSSTQTPGPGAVIRRPIKLLVSTVTPVGAVVRRLFNFKASSITPFSTVTKRITPTPRASTITPGPGTILRRPGKRLLSTITPSPGTIQGLLRKNFQGTITSSATVGKTLFRFYAGTIAASATMKYLIKKLFTGLIGPTEDYTVQDPTRQVAGIVKDLAGDPVEGATVKLFRVADDAYIASTTSAADGSYSFTRDQNDPFTYFVVAYEEVGTPTQGLTVRNLNPTVIP